MTNHTAIWLLVLSLTATLLHADLQGGQPLRVDINSDCRKDMRPVGWHNWRPNGEAMRQSFGDVNVSLRPGNVGGKVELKGSKAIVVHSVTLGADAAVCVGDAPALQVQVEGLATGKRTFVGDRLRHLPRCVALSRSSSRLSHSRRVRALCCWWAWRTSDARHQPQRLGPRSSTIGGRSNRASHGSV